MLVQGISSFVLAFPRFDHGLFCLFVVVFAIQESAPQNMAGLSHYWSSFCFLWLSPIQIKPTSIWSHPIVQIQLQISRSNKRGKSLENTRISILLFSPCFPVWFYLLFFILFHLSPYLFLLPIKSPTCLGCDKVGFFLKEDIFEGRKLDKNRTPARSCTRHEQTDVIKERCDALKERSNAYASDAIVMYSHLHPKGML